MTAAATDAAIEPDATGRGPAAEQPIAMDGMLRPSPLVAGAVEAFLPSPCVQNHAANLHVLPDGTLACVWFGGSQEGASDVSIHLSRLAPGARAWSPAERMSQDPERSEQNPVLFNAPDGTVWLFWTAQRFGNQDTAIVRRRISHDGGASFGPEHVFIAEPGTFVRQPIVVTPSGRMLLPVFACVARPGEKWSGDHDSSAVLVSDDGGANWRRVPVPGSTGCVHMNIAADPAGGWLAVFRSRFADAVYVSRSADGLAWSPPQPGPLPNNNSSIQLVARRGGDHAIVYNHAAAGEGTARRLNLYDEIEDEEPAPLAPPGPVPASAVGPRLGAPATGIGAAPARTAFWGTPRAPLSLAFSTDGARSFGGRIDLETGDGHCLTNNSRDRLNRELSYPTIVEDADGILHVAYTWHRRAIRYLRLGS